MFRLFRHHPCKTRETYIGHLLRTARSGFGMIIVGTLSIIHAIFPFLFPRVTRDFIFRTVGEYSALGE